MKELYLVTGATGHLGNTIIKSLRKSKKTVRALVLTNDNTDVEFDSDVEIIRGDTTNKETLIPFFKTEDENIDVYVIHTAAIVSIASKTNKNLYNVNVNGTKNVVDLCMEYGVKRLVHVSSVHAIEEKPIGEVITEVYSFNPDLVKGPYAKSKAAATKYVLDQTKKGLNAVVVHPSGIVGPNDYGKGHLTQLIISVAGKKLPAYVDGGYDFVDVRDVTKGIIKALKNGKSGECYILGNKYYTIKELLDLITKVLNVKQIKTKIPIWLASVIAPFSEMYAKVAKVPPLYTPYSLYTLKSNSLFSHDKASNVLKYTPRPMEETVEDTVDFLEKRKRIKIKRMVSTI